MSKRYKIGDIVCSRRALKYRGKKSPYRCVPTVQGGDYAWLRGKRVVVAQGLTGTIVSVPPVTHKYQSGHSSAALVVHWCTGQVTCVYAYDLRRHPAAG